MPSTAVVEEELGTISGDETGIQRGYVVANALDEIDAMQATRDHITAQDELHWPKVTDRLKENQSFYLHNIAIAEVEMVDRVPEDDQDQQPGKGLFKTIANYGFRATCPIVEWESRTESQRVFASLETIDARPHDRILNQGLPPDQPQYEGAIEVEEGRPNGADKLFPSRTVNVLWHPPPGFVTEEWQKQVRNLVTHTNSDPIFGAEFAHELLMVDVQVTVIDRRNDLHEVRLLMQYSEQNRSERTLGGIRVSAGILQGHSYVWFEREQEVDDNAVVVAPLARWLFIERLYDTADFSKVFKVDGTGENKVLGCPGFPDPGP